MLTTATWKAHPPPGPRGPQAPASGLMRQVEPRTGRAAHKATPTVRTSWQSSGTFTGQLFPERKTHANSRGQAWLSAPHPPGEQAVDETPPAASRGHFSRGA